MELGGDLIRKNGFRWTASVNASFIKSKVTKLYKAEGQRLLVTSYGTIQPEEMHRAQYIYREGQSTLSFYGYEWAGVDPKNGKNVWYVNDPTESAKGDFDYNGRPATYDYTKSNYKILGSALPDVYGGFNTDVEYKGISLGFKFQLQN